MKLFIVTGVPFSSLKEAREYAANLELVEDNVFEDTENAAVKAQQAKREVDYLITKLENLREEAHQRHAGIAHELENTPEDNILDRAKRQTLRERLLDELGYYCGIGEALGLLRNRSYELYKMGRARQE